MGLYDCRCMVTGVSLKGAEAALVLLQQAGVAYRPIALAITGTYNRLGAIDGIKEDANTRLVLAYFLDRLEAGAFVVDQDYLESHEFYPIEDIERLLGCFERNINDYGNAAVLNGLPVVFALVCRPVWAALARDAPTGGPAPEQFRSLFADVPVAQEMYAGKVMKVARHVRELAAVNSFLAGRGLAWRPAEKPGQHYAEEMRQYLAEARGSFADSPVVSRALDAYERKVADLLEDG